MISAMVASSTPPTALITSSRLSRVIAFIPLKAVSRLPASGTPSHSQPKERGRSSVAARSNRLFLRHQRSRCPTRNRCCRCPRPRRRSAARPVRSPGRSADCRRTSAIAGLPYTRHAGGVGDACRAAAIAHHGVETSALFLEARHQWPVDRAAARQLDAHRIDAASVDQDFVLNVPPLRLPPPPHQPPPL